MGHFHKLSCVIPPLLVPKKLPQIPANMRIKLHRELNFLLRVKLEDMWLCSNALENFIVNTNESVMKIACSSFKKIIFIF